MTVAAQFQFHDNVLHAEQVPLTELAQRFGTPLYVYSRRALRDAWQAYADAARDRDVLVCFGNDGLRSPWQQIATPDSPSRDIRYNRARTGHAKAERSCPSLGLAPPSRVCRCDR